MNSFYRICIYLCVVILIFTLAINFVNSLGAFPMDYDSGQAGLNSSNVLEKLTSLSDPTMNGVWLICISLGAIGAVTLSVLTRSTTPVGIYLFSAVFWTSWIRMWSVVNVGEMLPVELTQIFFIGALFLFIAAVIGMLTGSG